MVFEPIQMLWANGRERSAGKEGHIAAMNYTHPDLVAKNDAESHAILFADFPHASEFRTILRVDMFGVRT